MKAMGIEALVPKPSTSSPAPRAQDLPLPAARKRCEQRRTRSGAADITYIPMDEGHAYLVAIMDWHTRAVLSWQLSQHDGRRLLPACAAPGDGGSRPCPGDHEHRPGQPVHRRRIGSAAARPAEPAVSMDGKGRWMDNVFIERKRSTEPLYRSGIDAILCASMASTKDEAPVSIIKSDRTGTAALHPAVQERGPSGL